MAEHPNAKTPVNVLDAKRDRDRATARSMDDRIAHEVAAEVRQERRRADGKLRDRHWRVDAIDIDTPP